MADPHQLRLAAALQRKKASQERVQQVQGRLGAARDEQARVEQECRERGIAPDQLEEAIQRLGVRFDEVLTAFETGLKAAEDQLLPFGKD